MSKRVRLSFPNRRVSLSELQAAIVFAYCLACACCSLSAFVWGNSGSELVALVQRQTPWPTWVASRTPTAVAWVTGTPSPTSPASGVETPTVPPRPTEPFTPTATLTLPLAAPTLTITPSPTLQGTLISGDAPTPNDTPDPTSASSPLPTATPDTPTPTPTPTPTLRGTLNPGDAPTPTDTPSPAPSLTPTPSGVYIDYVEWDPPDDEYEGEYVLIGNRGPGVQDMTGWTLSDESNHVYVFPDGFSLAGGVSVRVWTKAGTDTQSYLYWGREDPVWGNEGDTAFLEDDRGNLVDSVTWPVDE